MAIYSTSVVGGATLDCLREDQDTKEDPKNWQVPARNRMLVSQRGGGGELGN
jgi:hypothetical protein